MLHKTTLRSGQARRPLPLDMWAQTIQDGALPWLKRHWHELWLLLLLLIVAMIHGINMFNFPYYETDEGTYMSQAWALVTQAKIAPYTYIYDHAPLGWLQIAIWSVLSGGFSAYGTTIESGRVLMLISQVASALVLYRIAQNTTRSTLVASVIMLLFAGSAYGLLYHRRVLLDNIATFWMLLSIYCLVNRRLTLTLVWASAFAFSMSVLSKELTIFLFPALVALVFVRAHAVQRWFATLGWVAISGTIISLYLVMAVLKGELFPTGTWLGGTADHVSLIGTLQWQAPRSKDAGMFGATSKFWEVVRIWVQDEPLLVIAGTASVVLSLFAIRRYLTIALFGAMSLLIWLFLGRGGEILPFYLVPLLPLLALNIGMLLWLVSQLARGWLGRTHAGRVATGVSLCIASFALLYGTTLGYRSPNLGAENQAALKGARQLGTLPWNSQQALAQREAITWIRQHIDPSKSIVSDNFLWVDLHSGSVSQPAYDHTHFHLKVELDPAIRQGIFHENWQNVDYVVTTPQLYNDVRFSNLPFISAIVAHSTPVATFNTGGWPVEIRRVHKLAVVAAKDDPLLQQAWRSYKAHFMQQGRVIDPSAGAISTSEGQSYALLQAVYMDDRATFDTTWGWAKAHLQTRGDSLMAWKWGQGKDGKIGVLNHGSATDAEQDAALALLFASRQWNTSAYADEARAILNSIWRQETAMLGGKRTVVAGDWARGEQGEAIVNPSYFAPYAYRIFAEADPAHAWMELVDSSYTLIEALQGQSSVGLVPNWAAIDPKSGKAQPATLQFGSYAAEYSFDASRTPWRLNLDWRWYGEKRAQAALARMTVLHNDFLKHERIVYAYKQDGTPLTNDEALSMTAGAIPAFYGLGDGPTAERLFEQKLLTSYSMDASGATFWGDPNNYYDQNWAFFSTTLVDGGMSNLWAGARHAAVVTPRR